MKNKKKLIIAISAFVIVAVGIYVAVQAGANLGGNVAFDVAVTEVERSTLETSVTAQGDVYLLPGQVASVNNTLEVNDVIVQVNDVVNQGDLLITFNVHTQERVRERERLVNQLQDTQLLLSSQQVNLQSLQLGATTIEIENATLNVSRASQGIQDSYFALQQIDANIDTQERAIVQIEMRLNTATNDLFNLQTLLSVGAATQQQIDNATTNLNNIETELLNAQTTRDTLDNSRHQAQQNITAAYDNLHLANIQLQDLQARVTSPQNQNAIQQQQIAVQRTQLAVQEIQRNINNLDDVEEALYAPVSGTITAVNIVPGAIATQGQTLVQINDADAFIIRAFVNERHAAHLGYGQYVEVEGNILGNQVIRGTIQHVSNIATTTTIGGTTERVIPIEVSLPNVDQSVLVPGVSLDITITTDIRENVIGIPLLSTLIDVDGNTFVYVVKEDNTLQQRFVQVVTHADMYIEVDGLYEGEILLLQPSPTMETGMLVNPILG